MKAAWTPEAIDEMRRHIDAGMSVGQIQIAMRMEFTRGSIAGKLSRLGIKTKNPPGNPLCGVTGDKPKAEKKVRLSPITKSNWNVHPRILSGEADASVRNAPDTTHRDSDFWNALPESTLIPVEQLSGSVCHWPIGGVGTDEFRFCGAACNIGMVYCPTHREMGTAAKVAGGMSRYEVARRASAGAAP